MPEYSDILIKIFHALSVILYDGKLCLLEAEFMVLFQDIIHIVEDQYGGEGKSGDQHPVQGQNFCRVSYNFSIYEISSHQGQPCVQFRKEKI